MNLVRIATLSAGLAAAACTVPTSSSGGGGSLGSSATPGGLGSSTTPLSTGCVWQEREVTDCGGNTTLGDWTTTCVDTPCSQRSWDQYPIAAGDCYGHTDYQHQHDYSGSCEQWAAAGSDPNATTAGIGGSVAGTPVPTADQSAVLVSEVSGGSTYTAAVVSITNISNMCGVMQRNGNPPSAQTLLLSVAQMGSSVSSGTFPLGATGATVSFVTTDGQCNGVVKFDASVGAITIGTANSTVITGTFDAIFPSGDHVAGSFSAPVCNVDLSRATVGACGT